jgi:hypothetical protein
VYSAFNDAVRDGAAGEQHRRLTGFILCSGVASIRVILQEILEPDTLGLQSNLEFALFAGIDDVGEQVLDIGKLGTVPDKLPCEHVVVVTPADSLPPLVNVKNLLAIHVAVEHKSIRVLIHVRQNHFTNVFGIFFYARVAHKNTLGSFKHK